MGLVGKSGFLGVALVMMPTVLLLPRGISTIWPGPSGAFCSGGIIFCVSGCVFSLLCFKYSCFFDSNVS